MSKLLAGGGIVVTLVLGLLSSCGSFFPQPPSVKLTPQSAPYTDPTNISIPYAIVDESTSLLHGSSSDNCQITLERKFDSGFLTLASYQQQQAPSGNLTFDLYAYSTVLSAGFGTLNAATLPYTGTYRVTVQILNNQNGQTTTLVSPVGQSEFTVMPPGEYVSSVSPPVLNTSNNTTEIHIYGQGFSSNTQVVSLVDSLSNSITIENYAYVNSGEVDALVAPSSYGGVSDNILTLQVNDPSSSAVSLSPFNIAILTGSITLAAVATTPPPLAPTAASKAGGLVGLVISGVTTTPPFSNLSTFATVTMTDSAGNSVPVNVDPRSLTETTGGNSFLTLTADATLSQAATGSATIAIGNPDGLPPVTIAFTINP